MARLGCNAVQRSGTSNERDGKKRHLQLNGGSEFVALVVVTSNTFHSTIRKKKKPHQAANSSLLEGFCNSRSSDTPEGLNDDSRLAC